MREPSGKNLCAVEVSASVKPMGESLGSQRPIGFSSKPLDEDEEALIKDLSELPGNPLLNETEIEKLMRERLVSNRDEIVQALKSIANSPSTNVKRDELFMVLNSFWIRLSDLQFEELLSDIQENGDGTVDFTHLLTKIEGKRRLKHGLTFGDKNKYGSPAPDSLTVPGLELLLQSKIHANMEQIARALLMYDRKGDGTISRENLKKVLDAFAVATKPTQFNNLMRLYDPHRTGFVNFRDFLVHLGLNVSTYEKRVPNRVTASMVFNWHVPFPEETQLAARKHALCFNQTDPRLLGLTLDQVVDKYEDKIMSKMEQLRKGFITYDVVNTGLISLADFRNVLNYFVFSTSDSLFRDLLFRFDVKRVGNLIPWEKFLETRRLKALKSPKQKHPVIHRWDKDPHSAVWTKINGAEICKCGDLFYLQGPIFLNRILKELRKFNIVPGPTTKKFFTIKTREGEKLMTRMDLKLFLGRRHCFFSDKEMTDLLNILDPDHTNYVSYDRFESMFCDHQISLDDSDLPEKKSNKDVCQFNKLSASDKLEKETINRCLDMNNLSPTFAHLSPEDALIKFRRRMHRNWESVEAAVLSRAHGRGGGFIHQEELKNILDVLVMNLTEPQWQHLIHRLGISTGQVNGRYFIDAFNELDVEALDHWNRRVVKWLSDGPKMQHLVHQDELENSMYEMVRTRGKEVHRDLARTDKRSLGYVSKGMFHKVLKKYLPKLTEKQFQTVWSRLPTNAYCNVDYGCFLRRYKHYYDSVPGHRCECECDFSSRHWTDERCNADHPNKYKTDRRLFAGGEDSDGSKHTEIKTGDEVSIKNADAVRLLPMPLSPKSSESPRLETSVNESGSKRELNNDDDSSSSILASTFESDHGVKVPFRPPTPPKRRNEKERKSGMVEQLVLPRKRNDDTNDDNNRGREKRQSAGMDGKSSIVDLPNLCDEQVSEEEREESKEKRLYCNCFYRYKPSSSTSASVVDPSRKSLEENYDRENKFRPEMSRANYEKKLNGFKVKRENVCDKRSICGLPTRAEQSKPKEKNNAEKILKDIVDKHSTEIRLSCNEIDGQGFGFVSGATFREILANYGVPTEWPTTEETLRKYGVPESGPVNYLTFLQNFVIHVPPERLNLLDRCNFPNIPPPKLGTPSAGLYDTLLGIRAPVLAHFTELRRVLRKQDKMGRGWIHALAFRKLLNQFNLPLSDERFFYLMEYFDPNLTGHISYNEFLRMFTSAH